LAFIRGDAQSMPFPDSSFDAVIPGGSFLFADLRNSDGLDVGFENGKLRYVSAHLTKRG
jgi:hypothetical protein